MKSAAGGGTKREALLDSKSHRKQSRKKVCTECQLLISNVEAHCKIFL